MGDVVSELASFSEKVATGAAGGLGLGFTLATCYFLYDTVENTFNDIWHVAARRSWFRKFLIFYPVVTLLPVLAGAYLYWSGRLIGSGHRWRASSGRFPFSSARSSWSTGCYPTSACAGTPPWREPWSPASRWKD